MKCFKYLLGIWSAIVVYSLFSFLCGPRGIFAYNQLLEEREKQWANIKELSFIHDELEKTQKNLMYDHETLMVHARQMGYGKENEQYIRIVGLTKAKNIPMTTGKVYFTGSPDFLADKIIKISAVCIGLLVFFFVFIIELASSKSRMQV